MYGPREFKLIWILIQKLHVMTHDAYYYIVPGVHDCSSFCFVQGEEHLTCYTFNTHQAKHTFCSKCGVQSFYTPRSNPDGRGVNYRCLDPGTVDNVNIITFDGQNWEATIEDEPSIRARSKWGLAIVLILLMVNVLVVILFVYQRYIMLILLILTSVSPNLIHDIVSCT